MNFPKIAIPLILSAIMAACSSTALQPAVPAQAAGGVLVGSNGMTLYTFDKDVADSGKSVCNGPCAVNWPPLLVAEGQAASGSYSVVTRDDDKKQWAVKGKPLYYWLKDQKPGDKTGDGVNSVWHAAQP